MDYKQGEKLCNDIITLAISNGYSASGITNLPKKKGDFTYAKSLDNNTEYVVKDNVKINSLLFTVSNIDNKFINVIEHIYIPSGTSISFHHK